MSLTPREQISSATMIATHELVTNLNRSKAAMESILHEMAEFMVLVTQEGRVIWGNSVAAEWLNVPHDLLFEANFLELFLEDDKPIVAARLGAIAERNAAADDLVVKVGRHGIAKDLSLSFRPFRLVSDRRGRLALVTGHDITEVLRARSERAKLEAELETAQILQKRFLPQDCIERKHLALSAFYRPADQCSGDWWGYFDLGEQRDLVCIADVTGHGAASALVTAMTQALCLSYVDRHKGKPVKPSELLREINEIVCRTFRGDMYMTFFCLVLDHKTQQGLASNAAHNFPFVLKANRLEGSNPEAIVVQGNPIGHSEKTEFYDLPFGFAAKDRIILYTDGIIECRNPAKKMYGAGAFRRSIIRHAGQELEKFRELLVDDAMRFYSGEPLADDITLAILDIL